MDERKLIESIEISYKQYCDLLTKLDQSSLVGLEQLFPHFQNPHYDPGNQYSVPISWGTTGLIYNRSRLSVAPQDWSFLWQYRHKLTKRITTQSIL